MLCSLGSFRAFSNWYKPGSQVMFILKVKKLLVKCFKCLGDSNVQSSEKKHYLSGCIELIGLILWEDLEELR